MSFSLAFILNFWMRCL